MKKKLMSMVLCVLLIAAMTVGCGGQETPASTGTTSETESTDTADGGESYTIATGVKDMLDPWCLRH